MEDTVVVYRCEKLWEPKHSHNLVIACSDADFDTERDEFLKKHLSIPHPHSLQVPGGAAEVVITASWFFVERARIMILHNAKDIQRVVGFCHQGCRYYKLKYPNLSSAEIRQQQISDLREFKTVMTELIPSAVVEAYLEEINQKGYLQYLEVR